MTLIERVSVHRPAGAGPVVARLGVLPAGPSGAVATLKHMRQFVRDALREPSQSIRLVALDIIKDLPSRNYRAEMTALHAFVRDQIRYVRDPEGIESVATPEKTLQLGQGDCDDKSTLLAALLMSVGHPVRFVAVGMGGGPLSHVLVESRLADKWVPLETIIPKPPGWYPSGVTKRFVLHI